MGRLRQQVQRYQYEFQQVKKRVIKKQKPKKNNKKLHVDDEIDEFLEGIDTEKMTHEEFLKLVRGKIKKLDGSKILVKEYYLEKCCEVCKKFNDDEHMLICDYCEDSYHSYCLNPPMLVIPDEEEEWGCPLCEQQGSICNKNKGNKRQSILEDHFKTKNKKDIQNCNKCQEQIKPPTLINNSNSQKKNKKTIHLVIEQKENCIRCKGIFHSRCFNNKKNSILCKECENQVKMKKKDLFRLPQILTDPVQIMKQKSSLIYALKAKNLEFDDDLRFSNQDCPSSCNDASLEQNLQKISSENLQIFLQFKEMTRQGNYPPIQIEEDKLQGFIVRALEDIPERTLICEYVGEVDLLRNRVFDTNDSIMELLKTPRSQTTLVICPEKYGNLARFLSGINNSSKESQLKQNVQSMRMNVKGHARVVLFAKRNIKQGEVLYYDYNAGGFDEYPTSDFV